MNHGTESDAAISTSEAEIAIADMTMRLTLNTIINIMSILHSLSVLAVTHVATCNCAQ